MNHQIRLAIGSDILGDVCLQERFTAYVDMLEHFVRCAPRSVCVARIAERSDFPVAALTRHAHELSRAGILKKLRGVESTWYLVKDPRDVTLEDVLRCAVFASAKRRRSTASRPIFAENTDIELLLMQAVQAVDDHLYKSLRTYSLDRLTVSRAAPFPERRCHSVPPFSEVD